MRLIDADALRKRFEVATLDCLGMEPTFRDDEVKGEIDNAPTIDAAPVVHGRWIYRKHGWAECSECHHNFHDVYDLDNADYYCRHCGARMDGEVSVCG